VEEYIIHNEADLIPKLIYDANLWCQQSFGFDPKLFDFAEQEVDGYCDVTDGMIFSRVLGDAFHVMERVSIIVTSLHASWHCERRFLL
jgi:hypothetical protein